MEMVKIEKTTPEEMEKQASKRAVAGKWTKLLAEIEADGVPRKVSDLTRGQIAALYRSARDAGMDYVTSYKDGYIIIGPAKEE